MTGVAQRYAWGSTTAIPNLLGEPPDGTPYAELWLGAHAKAPSHVDGTTLDALIAADPLGTLGPDVSHAYGATLPYLLKLLAADRPLSLQAHPDRPAAEAGYRAEEQAGLAHDSSRRVFRDAWPKPELLVALAPTEALCGFRDPRETWAAASALRIPALDRLLGRLADGSPQAVAEVFSQIVRTGPAAADVVDDVVAAARARSGSSDAAATGDGASADMARTLVELGTAYPGDAGVLAATLLHRVRLAPGQGLYLPERRLHAYLRGFGVEVMAASDNVLRGGLTTKPVAVDELLGLVELAPSRPEIVPTVETAPGIVRYVTPAPEFALWAVTSGRRPRRVPAQGSPRVLLCTSGSVDVRRDGRRRASSPDRVVLEPGRSVFAHPTEHLSVAGDGDLFVAAPGLPRSTTPTAKEQR